MKEEEKPLFLSSLPAPVLSLHFLPSSPHPKVMMHPSTTFRAQCVLSFLLLGLASLAPADATRARAHAYLRRHHRGQRKGQVVLGSRARASRHELGGEPGEAEPTSPLLESMRQCSFEKELSQDCVVKEHFCFAQKYGTRWARELDLEYGQQDEDRLPAQIIDKVTGPRFGTVGAEAGEHYKLARVTDKALSTCQTQGAKHYISKVREMNLNRGVHPLLPCHPASLLPFRALYPPSLFDFNLVPLLSGSTANHRDADYWLCLRRLYLTRPSTNR